MKYRNIIWMLLLLGSALPVQGQGNSAVVPGYYGFSGLVFIPTSQTLAKGDWSIAYKTKPGSGEDLNLLPFSLNMNVAPFLNGLEIGLTNTYVYASNKRYGGVPYKGSMDSLNTGLPLVPSLKYRFMDKSGSNYQISMAVGFGMPYGLYFVLDKFFDLKVADITLHSGIGTKLSTYHAFAGATLNIGKRIAPYRRDFPLQLSVEGSWGGSLNQLDQKEEAFVAVSMRHTWTQSIYLTAFYRIDQQPSVRNKVIIEKKPTRKMGLGIAIIL